MFRYRLRTLLMVLALGPVVLWIGWTKYRAWLVQREQIKTRREWLDKYGASPPPPVLRELGVETER